MGKIFPSVSLSILLITSICSICSMSQYIDYDCNFDHCQYNGDMCDIDAEKCWRQMADNGCVDLCHAIIDKPETPYYERGQVPYWIEIPGSKRYRYPEDATYTVVRHSGDWSEEGSLETVPECCSVKLDDKEHCILPQRNNSEEKFYVILPLNENSMDYFSGYPSFCFYEIEERPKPNEWCISKEHKPCIFVNSTGYFKKRYIFEPLNTEDIKVDVACVFSTEQELNSTMGEESHVVDDFYLYTSTTEMELPIGTKRTCMMKKGVQSDEIFHVEPPEDSNAEYYCCVIENENNRGPYAAKCQKLDVDDDADPVILVVSAVVSCFVIVATVTVLAVWVYKKHIKTCSYEHWMKTNSYPVKGEVLEEPAYLRNFMEPASNLPEVVEVSWFEDSGRNRAGFRREHIDSGFQDYECDDAPNHDVRNDAEVAAEAAADDSGNCDLGRFRKSIGSGESSKERGTDLSGEGNYSSSEFPAKSEREELLHNNHVEIPLSPTTELGVYCSA